LPKDSKTIKSWLAERYEVEKKELEMELRSIDCKIHISHDAWTSPNSLPILGVFAHYFNRQREPKTRLLRMHRIEGAHNGEFIAETLLKILRGVQIQDFISVFQCDNASSNDTCMTALIESLYPHASRVERRALIAAKRMCCQGHIINLAAKAFIEGVSEDLLESYAIDVDDVDAETLKRRRKSGPVGKLHNIVHWMRHIPQCRDTFTTVCKM
jgi:hypothetical protein